MKFISLHEFKKKREQQLMSNRSNSIFTRFDAKNNDMFTH